MKTILRPSGVVLAHPSIAGVFKDGLDPGRDSRFAGADQFSQLAAAAAVALKSAIRLAVQVNERVLVDLSLFMTSSLSRVDWAGRRKPPADVR